MGTLFDENGRKVLEGFFNGSFRPPTGSTNVNTRPPHPIVQRASRPR